MNESRKPFKRPTTKIGLLRYYEALHGALEREFTGFPEDRRVISISGACRELEDRLKGVPAGSQLISNARWNANNADPRTFAVTFEENQ